LHPIPVAPLPVSEPEPEPEPEAEPEPEPEPQPELQAQPEPESPFAETATSQPALQPVESLFSSEPAFADNPFGAADQQDDVATGDIEPMLAAHDESPFEEPVPEYTSAAASIEEASGFHIDAAPIAAEVAAPVAEESDVFAPAAAPEPFAFETPVAEPPADDFANTITMADLYAKQGLVDDARQIYENILARHPENDAVRAKLDAMTPGGAAGASPADLFAPEPAPETGAAPPSAKDAKVERLQSWLAKMKRSEVGRV